MPLNLTANLWIFLLQNKFKHKFNTLNRARFLLPLANAQDRMRFGITIQASLMFLLSTFTIFG